MLAAETARTASVPETSSAPVASTPAASSVAEADEAEALPSVFALGAVYPNPFNPAAVVPFALPEAAAVELAVYDMLGRRVAVLAEGAYPAGRHRVVFDGAALPSGPYLVRAALRPRAGAAQAFTQSVLLVK